MLDYKSVFFFSQWLDGQIKIAGKSWRAPELACRIPSGNFPQVCYMGVSINSGIQKWLVFVNGKIPSFEIDDEQGYPHDSGNPQIVSMTSYPSLMYQSQKNGLALPVRKFFLGQVAPSDVSRHVRATTGARPWWGLPFFKHGKGNGCGPALATCRYHKRSGECWFPQNETHLPEMEGFSSPWSWWS